MAPCGAIAGTAGIEMSTHLYPEVAGHLMRVTETAHWLEWQDWANPVLAEPFQLENGYLLIPDRPGNGIEWDEHAIMCLRSEGGSLFHRAIRRRLDRYRSIRSRAEIILP
jgi:L-alanine-DL-glutamate epimerase-like enolase superfamily enzyme